MPKPTASANILAELTRRDVSQAAIAEVLGISPAQVSARIHGRIAWRLPEVQAIADHLNMPLFRLIEDEFSEPPVAAEPGSAVPA